MAEEMKPAGYAYPDGYWCETDALQSRFNGMPFFTLAQVQAREAAAWEQGRTASAEVADGVDFANSHSKARDNQSMALGAEITANTIRALPNPHKHGRG